MWGTCLLTPGTSVCSRCVPSSIWNIGFPRGGVEPPRDLRGLSRGGRADPLEKRGGTTPPRRMGRDGPLEVEAKRARPRQPSRLIAAYVSYSRCGIPDTGLWEIVQK